MAWKRVYVEGKGYRYTDGNGNYRLTNPQAKQTVKKAIKAVYGAAQGAADNLNRLGIGIAKAKTNTSKAPTDSDRTEFLKEQKVFVNRKVGQKATLNGKPVTWDGKKWVQKPTDTPQKDDSNSTPKTDEAQRTKPPVRVAPQPTTVQKPAAKPVAKPADKPKPMTQMGDVRGAKFEGGPSANEKLTVGKTRYEGESLTGVKSDGSDVERRRAFLDAEDSRKGIKAVRDLLEKRKKEKKFSR